MVKRLYKVFSQDAYGCHDSLWHSDHREVLEESRKAGTLEVLEKPLDLEVLEQMNRLSTALWISRKIKKIEKIGKMDFQEGQIFNLMPDNLILMNARNALYTCFPCSSPSRERKNYP